MLFKLIVIALLLAYMKGNVTLCKALVRAGSCLAATNKNGVSIFNYQLATKQLLVRQVVTYLFALRVSMLKCWQKINFVMQAFRTAE